MASPLLKDARRLSKVVARLDARDDGSIPAFNLLSQALAASGSSWMDALAPLLEKAQPAQSAGARKHRPSSRTKPQDINDWLKATDFTQPRPAPAQRILQGMDVPQVFEGIVTVREERQTRRGQAMLIVAIENGAALCDPVAVFDAALVAAILSGSCLSGTAHITPPSAPHLYPVLTSFLDVRQAA